MHIKNIVKNKKAQWFFRIIYAALLLFGLWGLTTYYFFLVNDAECSQLNPSCPSDEYCGVDFVCHPLTDQSAIQSQTEIIRTYTVMPGIAFIILSVLIAYSILRGGLPWKKR